MEGIPYRHEIAVCIMVLKKPAYLKFAQRWEKEYFIFEEKVNYEEEKEDNQVI